MIKRIYNILMIAIIILILIMLIIFTCKSVYEKHIENITPEKNNLIEL